MDEFTKCSKQLIALLEDLQDGIGFSDLLKLAELAACLVAAGFKAVTPNN